MALKGTTWTFNDVITEDPEIEIIGLDLFKDPTRKMYKALSFLGTSDLRYSYNTKAAVASGKKVFKDGAWVGNDYKTITFINEPSTILPDETSFMTWLRANATQTSTEDTFYSVSKSEMEYIADTIRGRTGGLEKLTFPDGYASAIRGLDTSDANATAGDIRNGKTAYVKGEKLTGTYVPQAKVYKRSLTVFNGTLGTTLPIGNYSAGSLIATVTVPSSRFVEEITDFAGMQYGQAFQSLTAKLSYTSTIVDGKIIEIKIYAASSGISVSDGVAAYFGWNGYEAVIM